MKESIIVWLIKRIYRKSWSLFLRIQKHDKILLSPIDMMVPLDGVITAGQYVIISRLLDLDLIREGKPTIWDKRLTSLERQNKWTEEDANYYKELVESLDKWGWDYNLSSIYINKKPLYAYNGTHRMAYALKNNPYQVIPFISFINGWEWSCQDGYRYWKDKGMTEVELDQLSSEFNKLFEDIETDLFFVLSSKDYKRPITDDIIEVSRIQEFIVDKHMDMNPGINKDLFRFFKKENMGIVVLTCKLKKQRLRIRKHKIESQYFEEYAVKYKTAKFYYTATITEAVELRLLINNYCHIKLNEQDIVATC